MVPLSAFGGAIVRIHWLIFPHRWLYSFAIFIGGQLSYENIFNSIFPVVFKQYWFANAYLILMITQPILKNFFINQKKQEKLKYFVLLSLLFYSPNVVGLVLNIKNAFVLNETLSFFMIAYAGHLIKEYNEKLTKKYFKLVIISFIITWALILLRPIIIEYGVDTFNFDRSFLIDINSFNALLFSSSLFVIVQKIKIPKFSLIFASAPLVFDVYLIHDNRIIRPLIWQTIFNNPDSFSKNYFPLIVIVEPLIVFFVCLLLAKVRVIIFNKFHEMTKTTKFFIK
ncbi:acyltransferase family protein [Enterococcus olivae]